MHPNAHTSERLSATRPFACSGLMYVAVPRIRPACVAVAVSVGEFERSVASGSTTRARPKSRDLHLSVGRQHDVGGFQIAVDDALLVRGFEGVEDLAGDGERFR